MNKNYLLFTILAIAVAVPTAFAATDLIMNISPTDSQTDGDTNFSLIAGSTSVAMFTNGSSNFAIIASHDNDAVTIVDVTNPAEITFLSDYQAIEVYNTDTTHSVVLDGARDVEVFTNGTGDSNDAVHWLAAVVSDVSDGIQILNMSDARNVIHPLANYTASGLGNVGEPSINLKSVMKDGRGELDGAYDLALFDNTTAIGDAAAKTTGKLAIVTSALGDSVQIVSLRDPTQILHLGDNHTDGTGGAYPNLVLDGAAGVDTYTIDSVPYAIVTAFVEDGFQLFDLRDPLRSNACGYSDAAGDVLVCLGSDGLRPPGKYANATDGNNGFNLLDGAIDVDTYTDGSSTYGIIVANADNAFTLVNLGNPSGKVFEYQVSNGTLPSEFDDGASSVNVFKVSDRPFAVITSNATSSSGVALLDLNDPVNPLWVQSVFDGGVDYDDTDLTYNELLGANGIATYYQAPFHYALVASQDDDGIQIIQLTADPVSGGNPVCGVTLDCDSPSITRHGNTETSDGFSINNTILANQDRYNENDTFEANVGQLITIKARVHDSWSVNSIEKSLLYFDMQTPNWQDANSSVKYNVLSDEVTVSGDNFTADVSSAVVTNPYGDNPSLEMLDVTFKIMFTSPMDTSHMAMQSVDSVGNNQIIYFKNAISISGQPTQTAADETIEDDVTQVATASVPDWVKNTAGWWAEGLISEGEFVKGVEFLIKQQIIDTTVQTTSSENLDASVPDWVKNTAGWWAEGQISEGEFVNAIEHLVKTGTIIII